MPLSLPLEVFSFLSPIPLLWVHGLLSLHPISLTNWKEGSILSELTSTSPSVSQAPTFRLHHFAQDAATNTAAAKAGNLVPGLNQFEFIAVFHACWIQRRTFDRFSPFLLMTDFLLPLTGALFYSYP